MSNRAPFLFQQFARVSGIAPLPVKNLQSPSTSRKPLQNLVLQETHAEASERGSGTFVPLGW